MSWTLSPPRFSNFNNFSSLLQHQCACAWDRGAVSFVVCEWVMWIPKTWLWGTWIVWSSEIHWVHRETDTTTRWFIVLVTLRTGRQLVSPCCVKIYSLNVRDVLDFLNCGRGLIDVDISYGHPKNHQLICLLWQNSRIKKNHRSEIGQPFKCSFLVIWDLHPKKSNVHWNNQMNVLIDIFPGVQLDRQNEDDMHSSHCCLVAIGRLQVSRLTARFSRFNFHPKNVFFARRFRSLQRPIQQIWMVPTINRNSFRDMRWMANSHLWINVSWMF